MRLLERPYTPTEKHLYKTHFADAVIILQSGEVYLQQREPSSRYAGTVSLFGGHVEENETPLEAVIREVQEETGGDPRIDDVHYIASVTEGWTSHFDIVHLYFWHDKDGTITGCYEGSPLTFPSIETALDQANLMDYARRALEKIRYGILPSEK